jgi:hypothetical protein
VASSFSALPDEWKCIFGPFSAPRPVHSEVPGSMDCLEVLATKNESSFFLIELFQWFLIALSVLRNSQIVESASLEPIIMICSRKN